MSQSQSLQPLVSDQWGPVFACLPLLIVFSTASTSYKIENKIVSVEQFGDSVAGLGILIHCEAVWFLQASYCGLSSSVKDQNATLYCEATDL